MVTILKKIIKSKWFITKQAAWTYNEQTRHLLHRVHRKCMAVHPQQTQQVFLAHCDVNDGFQQWYFKQIKPKW